MLYELIVFEVLEIVKQNIRSMLVKYKLNKPHIPQLGISDYGYATQMIFQHEVRYTNNKGGVIYHFSGQNHFLILENNVLIHDGPIVDREEFIAIIS